MVTDNVAVLFFPYPAGQLKGNESFWFLGGMVAKLKLKRIGERASPGVEEVELMS